MRVSPSSASLLTGGTQQLTASVTDGAVGVTVDAPVTVSAEDGGLGAVTMTVVSGRETALP